MLDFFFWWKHMLDFIAKQIVDSDIDKSSEQLIPLEKP